MFFGFGWAVLGGFLLTSTKNWVNIRGYHGGILAGLALAWLGERLGMWFQGDLPPLLFRASNNLFLLAIVALLLVTLVRHRNTRQLPGGQPLLSPSSSPSSWWPKPCSSAPTISPPGRA